MIKRSLISFTCLLATSGCAKLFRYEHVVLHDRARLVVAVRSTDSKDAQGEPLHGAKIGLPIRSTVTAADYSVIVYTPLNFRPVVFLRAEDKAKKPLQLRGPSIREMDQRAGVRVVDGYTHVFDLGSSAKGEIQIEVLGPSGSLLGQEKLNYDVVSRGYKWEVNAP